MNPNAKKIIGFIVLGIFFLIIIIYAFFRSKDLVFGVKIKNVNIVDGSTVTQNVLPITGNAENAIDLTLDGREISIDNQGNFNETIALLLGYNVIDIYAKDKFNNSDEKIYKLIYSAPAGQN